MCHPYLHIHACILNTYTSIQGGGTRICYVYTLIFICSQNLDKLHWYNDSGYFHSNFAPIWMSTSKRYSGLIIDYEEHFKLTFDFNLTTDVDQSTQHMWVPPLHIYIHTRTYTYYISVLNALANGAKVSTTLMTNATTSKNTRVAQKLSQQRITKSQESIYCSYKWLVWRNVYSYYY